MFAIITKGTSEIAKARLFLIVLNCNFHMYYLVCCSEFLFIFQKTFPSTIISLFRATFVILFSGGFNFMKNL